MNHVRRSRGVALFLSTVLLITSCVEAETPTATLEVRSASLYQQGGVLPATLWVRQFGTSESDVAWSISVDGSGVYVAGYTEGSLPRGGQAGAGSSDAFVRTYDGNGNELWTRQFGTGGFDKAFGIAVGGTGVYVAGHTEGTLPGQSSAGRGDAFVRKYDVNGSEVWTRQFGTSAGDLAWAIAVDGGGVYVTGQTNGTFPDQSGTGHTDAFVRKYDVDGNEVWTRQFGVLFAVGETISVDRSGVYVAGIVAGSLPGQTSAGAGFTDGFARKYDLDGNELWTRQFGTPGTDVASGISVDGTGVYVAGRFGADAFVRRYDLRGNEIWFRLFGTDDWDDARAISADGMGVHVVGETFGTFPGQISAVETDAFVRKYDVDGNEVWTRQFGSADGFRFDEANGVSADGSGVYLAGHTQGSFLGQTHIGFIDAFVIKLAPPGRVIEVSIVIKPGDAAASINPRSRGTLAVAIVTTATFDAASVHSSTARFGRTGTEATPVHSTREDVDADGDADLLLHFRTQETGLQCGNTSASLIGENAGGEVIRGEASIRTVGC